MDSIYLITWANIKRRKIQTLLVVICIALAVLMLSTLIGIGLGMNRPFENLYARLNAAHIVMTFDLSEHDPKVITEWFLQQPEVVGVTQPRVVKFLRKKLIFKEQELFNTARFTEFPGNDTGIDQLFLLEGKEQQFPAPGEIWIPNSWVSKTGLAVGDTLQVPTQNGLFPLLVSGIAINAQNANGLGDPNPVWVGPGSLSMLFPIQALSNVNMGIRLNDAAVTEQVWARFHEANDYKGGATLYDFFKKIF
ncbi:MAG: hypothetical protein AAGJ18_29135, partial [Bacteroidota bacterium]